MNLLTVPITLGREAFSLHYHLFTEHFTTLNTIYPNCTTFVLTNTTYIIDINFVSFNVSIVVKTILFIIK